MNERQHLLVVDVLVRSGVIAEPGEVHDVAELITKADGAAGIRFHGDDGWQVVHHADGRPNDVGGQSATPPLEISQRALTEGGASHPVAEAIVEVGAQALQVRPATAANHGDEAELSEDRLQLSHQHAARRKQAGDVPQYRGGAVRCHRDLAGLRIKKETEELQARRRPLRLSVGHLKAEPLDDALHHLDVLRAGNRVVSDDEDVVDEDCSADAESREHLAHLRGHRAGECRRQLEAQRNTRPSPKRRDALASAAQMRTPLEPLCGRRPRALPRRTRARVTDPRALLKHSTGGATREEFANVH